MAVFDAILTPYDEAAQKVTALATATSSAAVSLGKNSIFSIVGTQDFHIRFGVAAVGEGVTGDFLIPANTITVFDLGNKFTHIRMFNDSGSNVDLYIQKLSRI